MSTRLYTATMIST